MTTSLGNQGRMLLQYVGWRDRRRHVGVCRSKAAGEQSWKMAETGFRRHATHEHLSDAVPSDTTTKAAFAAIPNATRVKIGLAGLSQSEIGL
jgi:hypothetical protein